VTTLIVGQTLPLSLSYKDANGNVMLKTPAPDTSPAWSHAAPTITTLTSTGITAAAKSLAAGSDTIAASLAVAGKPFSATLPLTVTAVSGLKFNFIYDPSWATAPAGAQTALNTAAAALSAAFPSKNVTISIQVGWGECAQSPLGSGDLGSSLTNYDASQSYSGLRSALIAKNAPGASTLPSASPLPGIVFLAQAASKALGLYSGTVTPDGWVGFSKSVAWNFTTAAAAGYYLIGTIEHEITEVMGRVSMVDMQPNFYGPMDLFRYSAPGVRSHAMGASGSTAYFSVDNGVTNLGSWNNNGNNGDLGDWYPSGPVAHDACSDYSSGGVINAFSVNDIKLMQAIGWM
jgi:hypothetical protein